MVDGLYFLILLLRLLYLHHYVSTNLWSSYVVLLVLAIAVVFVRYHCKSVYVLQFNDA